MSDIISSPWRHDFPMLNAEVHDSPLIYLDSAATAQKPQCVIDRISTFYSREYASVHRGIHHLSAVATDNMEHVRQQTADYIHAASSDNIVFTKGTTEGINLVANTLIPKHISSGDEIIITEMEHHANIVPWQMAIQQHNITLKIWPIRKNGTLSITDLLPLLSKRTKLITMTHVSNVLGTITPIQETIQIAKSMNIATLIDGAQAIMHEDVNVKNLGCDFYVFSGHKLYGPTGIGILYMSEPWLEILPPWEGGGSMIETVSLTDQTIYQRAPCKFEAGTPNIVGIMGLGTALDYINNIGMNRIREHEESLMKYTVKQLNSIDSLHMYGPLSHDQQTGVISFNLGHHHAFDVGSFLDHYGIAIRTGHHCAMPLLNAISQHSVCRLSIALYSSQNDIDTLVHRLKKIETLLG